MENEEKKIEELEEDPFVEVEFKEVANTGKCEHFYCEDELQDKNNELLSLRCIKCPSGISINPDEFFIEDGKVYKK